MGLDCPHDVCITVFNDIYIWHQLLSTFLPFYKLIIVFYILYLIGLYRSNDLIIIKYCNFFIYNIFNYIKKLYSNGILNPKSP